MDISPDAVFDKMAEKIRRNADDFGGAAVIIPPDGNDPVELLILDTKKGIAQFWALIQTRAQLAIAEADAKTRQEQGFRTR